MPQQIHRHNGRCHPDGKPAFDRRSNDQQKRSLVKRLADLGYTVEVKPLTP
jgi:hypothetical protein